MNTEEENKTSNPSSKIKNEIECTIGSICSRFSSGKGITAEKISPTGEYPVYGGNGVRGYTDNYNFEGQCVVIGRQGANCGNVKYFEGKAYMSEHAIVGVTHQEHDNRYFAYKLSMLNLGRFSGQAAQPGLSVAKLKTLKMTMPNFNIQYRIASILSAYDRLIENNTRRIRLLEQMAENLYKEWFVRFRFPEHEKVEMVNGLPKGWNEEELGNIADVCMGSSPKSEYYNDEKKGLPFHQGVGSFGERFVLDNTYSTSYSQIANPMSILFSVRAPVGRLNYTRNRIAIGRGVAAINHKEGMQSLLFYTLKAKFFKEDIVGNGAIFSSITKKELLKLKLIVPIKELRVVFNNKINKIDREIDILYKQNQLLTRQRDLLLPRLMSGKLEVKS